MCRIIAGPTRSTVQEVVICIVADRIRSFVLGTVNIIGRNRLEIGPAAALNLEEKSL